jgi:hypothetical protein
MTAADGDVGDHHGELGGGVEFAGTQAALMPASLPPIATI